MRNGEQEVAYTVPNTGLAIGIDIGEANHIHPGNKQEVGRRLALVALKKVYGQDVVASGPTVTDAKFESGKVVLSFDPGGKDQKLVFKDSATNGFELAGVDGVYKPAAFPSRTATSRSVSPRCCAHTFASTASGCYRKIPKRNCSLLKLCTCGRNATRRRQLRLW